MNLQEEPIFQWLAQYAFQPQIVYLGIVGFMIASGFGLPIPEEITILSVGILAYMGTDPENFPPPVSGAHVVDGIDAAIITTLAVLFADLLVFNIGRKFGRKIIHSERFAHLFAKERLGLINSWISRYGVYAAFFFRFTPGIRFPAHIILGMSELKSWKFMLFDGVAALISVPTQILLIAKFGEPILQTIHKFKMWFFIGFAALLLILIVRRLYSAKIKPASF